MDVLNVSENYDKAKQLFATKKDKKSKLIAWNYLLTAYNDLRMKKFKDHLLCARILFLMGKQNEGYIENEKNFNDYFEKAKEEYEEYMQNNNPTKEISSEYKNFMHKYKQIYASVKNKHKEKTNDDKIQYIENKEIIKNFFFEGSKITNVEINNIENYVVLRLKNEKEEITLRFNEIFELNTETYSIGQSVNDFYLHKQFYEKDEIIDNEYDSYYVFQIDGFKIVAKEIVALEAKGKNPTKRFVYSLCDAWGRLIHSITILEDENYIILCEDDKDIIETNEESRAIKNVPISEKAKSDIDDIFNKDASCFDIDELEDNTKQIVLDGWINEFDLIKNHKLNHIVGLNLWSYEDLAEAPNVSCLLNILESIKHILVKEGIDEKYFNLNS